MCYLGKMALLLSLLLVQQVSFKAAYNPALPRSSSSSTSSNIMKGEMDRKGRRNSRGSRRNSSVDLIVTSTAALDPYAMNAYEGDVSDVILTQTADMQNSQCIVS